MSGIMLGLCALFAAYCADLLASHWGFDGQSHARLAASQVRYAKKRKISSKPNGQLISRSPARSTGIRVP